MVESTQTTGPASYEQRLVELHNNTAATAICHVIHRRVSPPAQRRPCPGNSRGPTTARLRPDSRCSAARGPPALGRRSPRPPANATGYVDQTADPATTYAYRVRAANATGSSAYMGKAEATTPSATQVTFARPPSLTANDIDIAAHSLGNLDMWDMVRLNGRIINNAEPIVHNITSCVDIVRYALQACPWKLVIHPSTHALWLDAGGAVGTGAAGRGGLKALADAIHRWRHRCGRAKV